MSSPLLERLRRAVAPDYTVERELAGGGMGIVYLGRDPTLDRAVAIKLLRPDLATARIAQRFLQEARILAGLRHPNLVTIHGVGERDGLFYYVMEYLAGETLAARLTRGPLSLAETMAMARGLLSALSVVHRRDVVHRDITPANIFLLPDRAVLTDFGVARSLHDEEISTRPGEVIGTRLWMAPEQAAGRPVSPQTDLYALATVLYYAATGRRWPPHQAPSGASLAGIPAGLARGLRKALQLAPGDRWADADEFVRALESRPTGRWWVSLAAVAVVVVLATYLHSRRGPPPPADLAIQPFESLGGDTEMPRLLAHLVAGRLEAFPRWSVVPSSLTLGANGSSKSAGNSYRARQLIDGSIVPAAAGFVLHLYIRDSTGTLRSEPEIPGSQENLLDWSKAAAMEIARAVAPAFAESFREFEEGQSSDLRAWKALLLGQEAYQRDQWTLAESHYRQALAIDSDFVQAAWALAMVGWQSRNNHDRDLLRLYRSQGARMPELYRLLTSAYLASDVRQRLQIYERATRSYPADGDAAMLYGNEAFSRGPLVGVGLDSALTLFARAADKDPYRGQAPAYDHIVWGNIRLGRRQAASRALDVRSGLPRPPGNTDVDVSTFLRLAYYERFYPRLAPLLRSWILWNPDSGTVAKVSQIVRLAVTFDVPAGQVGLAKVVATQAKQPALRANGLMAEAIGHFALGQARAGLSDLDSATQILGGPDAELERLEWRLIPSVLGYPIGSAAEVTASREPLAAMVGRGGAIGSRAAWTLALEAHQRGDTAVTNHWDGQLRRFAAHDSTAARLERLARALAAATGGHPDSALALSDPLLAFDSTGRIGGPFFRSTLHLLRGQWWHSAGRPDLADREWLWYENSDLEGWPSRETQAGEVDAVMSGYGRLLRGRLGLEGHAEAACDYVVRARELWAAADSDFVPLRRLADSLGRSCRS